MSVLDKARVVIYRFHEKGLEIFLINTSKIENDPTVWQFPQGSISKEEFKKSEMIQLDPIEAEDGEMLHSFAIEGDWHDIPSIRGLLKHDVKRVKSKIIELLPGDEEGAFVNIKEAIKKVMPHEYGMLKELKDILFTRNIMKGL